jgi:hypothetical protein
MRAVRLEDISSLVPRDGIALTLLRILTIAIIALLLLTSLAVAQPARDYFGAVHQPSSGPEAVIGSYATGCIGGAVQLPADGPAGRRCGCRETGAGAVPSL